jgi:PAS domain-containing protein
MDCVRWEVRPWYTNTDEIGGIIIFSEIITDRKRQEAALLQSERKFSSIFNQTFQLMGLVSLDGVLLEVNQAALASIGISESEIVGKSFGTLPGGIQSSSRSNSKRRSLLLPAVNLCAMK